jgi:3-oxoacyl-(acyl-carrier-protein) synthase
MTRAAVFGWGLVAPGAANIDEFSDQLARCQSFLEPFNGFGPDSFLVGKPKFDFSVYEPWLSQRFPKSRAKQLLDKMDTTTLYAIGAFIQSLSQNPGIEQELRQLGPEAHVYVGNALGALPTLYDSSIELYRAQRRWNRFWAAPERNEALVAYQAGKLEVSPPTAPETFEDEDEREQAEDAWFAFWAERSTALSAYLTELREIESQVIEGEVEAGKMKLMRDKRRRLSVLQEKWRTPTPPWNAVSASVLWNIPNTPASQISMLGRITGPAYAPVGACSTFGIALQKGLSAIKHGEAKLVVIGSADPPPHPLSVGAFYSARVLSADGAPSKPLSQLKGTHVAGGACIWVLGDLDWGLARGFVPLGAEPLAVGVTSDADHIITPSAEGPENAMRTALRCAGVAADEVVSWDLHATATPGDYQELANLERVLEKPAAISARKGTFGHGMGVGGGWELTAQYLGVERGSLFPTTLAEHEVHPSIRALSQRLVLDEAHAIARGPVGKLSMGVGGVNACVISTPWDEETKARKG